MTEIIISSSKGVEKKFTFEIYNEDFRLDPSVMNDSERTKHIIFHICPPLKDKNDVTGYLLEKGVLYNFYGNRGHGDGVLVDWDNPVMAGVTKIYTNPKAELETEWNKKYCVRS